MCTVWFSTAFYDLLQPGSASAVKTRLICQSDAILISMEEGNRPVQPMGTNDSHHNYEHMTVPEAVPVVFIHGIKGGRLVDSKNNVHLISAAQCLAFSTPLLALPMEWDGDTQVFSSG